MLNTTATVLELVDCLHVAQDHSTAPQKYWLLARGMHVDYSTVHNLIGEFLTFKGRLYMPKSLVLTILYEYHDARGPFGQQHT